MTDKNNIERLFKSHYMQLHREASMLLQDGESARDIVNDVFVTLLSSSSEVEVTSGYLYTAVRNRCLSHIRNTDIRKRILNLYFKDIEDYDEEEWPDEETVARIYEIIKEDLNPQCRRVMELRFCEGLTFAKVAQAIGISENAVYKYVRQALVLIRKKLNENG